MKIKFSNCDKNDNLLSIVQKSSESAIEAFKNFANILNLNPDAYEHLYNINVIIQKENDDSAYYNNDKNEIDINYDYWLDVSKKYDEKKITSNMAKTIIHEMIHGNRSILMNYNKEKKNDLKYYESLLDTIVAYDNSILNNKYIVIKISFYENKQPTIIAFNTQNSNFEIFNNVQIETKLSNDANEFIKNLSIELSNKDLTYNKKISDNPISNKTLGLPSDFVQEEFYSNDNVPNNANTTIVYKKALEEILTEALATIIYMSKDSNNLNIDEIFNKLTKFDCDKDLMIGIYLFKSLGIDTIKWFMTSTYDNIFVDKFSTIFADKYESILQYSHYIYNNPDDFTSSIYYKCIESIIEEKTKRTR